MQIMCVNNILTTQLHYNNNLITLSTRSSDAIFAMDGIHGEIHYSKYIFEYICPAQDNEMR